MKNASILTSIKEVLGLPDDYEHFDNDVLMHINSTFMILNQLGVGPEEGFSITNKDATWSEYLGSDSNLELVKSFMYLKVRLLFDPPTNSFLVDAIDRQIKEFEWRLNIEVDKGGI